MPEWTPDPLEPRFVPDPELEARAQRHMMAMEREWESPTTRRARQQWSHAMAASRVALAALRDIWPESQRSISADAHDDLSRALDYATELFAALDRVAPAFEGQVVIGVASGDIRTHEELDAMGVER